MRFDESGIETMSIGRDVLIDTDVLVDFLRGDDRAITYVNEAKDRLHLSVVVIAELYAGVRPHETDFLDELVSVLPSIPVTPQIARSAGLLRNEYAASHGVRLADALIAATAMEEGLDLATRNIKHYPMLPGVAPPY